jgi:hypothetical protein
MGAMKDWFERSDSEFMQSVQRVMTARTSAHPMSFSKELDWTEFREAMRELLLAAEQRHAAKYAAIREAEIAIPSIFVRQPLDITDDFVEDD